MIVTTPLDVWRAGRPARLKRENLIARTNSLAEYCESLIKARGEEIGANRDAMHKIRQVFDKCVEDRDFFEAMLGVEEGDNEELRDRLDQALLAIERMSWGIMHKEYGKTVLEHPDNAERLKELKAEADVSRQAT